MDMRAGAGISSFSHCDEKVPPHRQNRFGQRFFGRLCFLACLLLSAWLALGASTGASCSITVTNPNPEATYSAYRMMIVADSGSDSVYFYALTSEWGAFFTSGAGVSYVSYDGSYYTWADGMDSSSNMEAFAASAKAYAESASLTPAATATADSAGSAVTLSGLEAGYYLVTSSSGSKAMVLTTAGSDAEITEKNPLPTVTLQIQDGEDWVSTLSVNSRDIFYCKAIITVQDAAGPYKLKLSLTDGLAYYNTASVYLNSVSDGTILTKGTEYTEAKSNTLTSPVITFPVDYISNLTAGDQLIIVFRVRLMAASTETSDYSITASLSYDSGTSAAVAVTVQSFSFEIVKTDGDRNLLDGAQFYLYDAATDGNQISVCKDSPSGGYRIPYEGVSEAETAITATDGTAIVYGLKNGTYYLEETVAPTGYNVLPNRQAVTIAGSSLAATMNEDGTYASGGVQVINKTGTVLPATGGIGTAVFYIVGSLLMLAAVVYFVARRRAAEEDSGEGSR